MTGEVICEAGTKLTDELCDKIQNAGAPSVTVRIDEIEEGLSSIRVPRLILQPLVENSIYHGIRPKGEHGVIRVTVKRQEDFLFLSVYDNGIGMSAHQRELLFSGKDSRSFGFQGTIERIRYYYKTEDVFEIHSTEGEYCEIILKLPLSNGC